MIETRRNEDGTIDSIIASGELVHLEQTADSEWFLSIGDLAIYLSSESGPVVVTVIECDDGE